MQGKSLPRWPLATLALSVALLSACAGRPKVEERNPKTYGETGSIETTVVSVVPFEAIAKQLGPNFKVDGEETLKEVLAITSSTQSRVENATSMMLRLALGGTTRSGESTQTTESNSDGTTTTSTSTRRSVTAPGDPASVPAATIPADSGAAAPALKDLSGHNAILRRQLATNLLQEIVMLNNYVRDAPRKAGYDQFIVRLQVTVRPTARYTPFDALVNTAFACGEDCSGTPIVVPLLVNDNMDVGSLSNLERNITQLGLALGSMRGLFGVLGEFGSRADDTIASMGWQYNSIFNVSRSDDGALSVRIGAQAIGSNTFELLPRTHAITALLLVKRPEAFNPSSACNRFEQRPCATVKMTSKSQFVHAKTGEPRDDAPTSKGQEFQVTFWGDPQNPLDGQSAALRIVGDKAPYSANLVLKGGDSITLKTYNSAYLMRAATDAPRVVADGMTILDSHNSIKLEFAGLSEDIKKDLAGAERFDVCLTPGPEICGATNPSIRCQCASSACPWSSGQARQSDPSCPIRLKIHGKPFVTPEPKAEATAKVRLADELVVSKNGDAKLPVIVAFPTTPKLAKVTLAIANGVPATGLTFHSTSGCAAVVGTKVEVTQSCNFDLPIRGLKQAAETCCKADLPTLKVDVSEVPLNDKGEKLDPVAGDPVTLRLVAEPQPKKVVAKAP